MSSKEFWDARYLQQPESWGENPNQFLAEIDLGDCETAVDLAGGNGRNSLWLAAQGLKVENIDISPVALEQFLIRAEQRGLGDLCLAKESDAISASFSFSPDLLVIAYLQITPEDLQESFHNALAQLKPGSRVFGVWHAVENLESGYGGPPDKNVLVSRAQLEKLGSKFEWSELSIENQIREVETENFTREAIDVVLSGRLKV